MLTKVPMTKAEEIEHLKAFVSGLPRNSYLEGFMAGAVEAFSNSVAQDLSFPTLSQIWSNRESESRQAAEDQEKLRQATEEMRQEFWLLERKVAQGRNDMEEIRATARRLTQV